MVFKLFLVGITFLLVGYLIHHKLIKGKKPSSKETNWEGMTNANYIGLWGSVVICFMCGIVFVLKSLPSQI